MKHIVLLGNFGATNIGDEALLHSMLHLFRLDGKHQIHVLSSHPEETLHRYAAPYDITSSYLFPVGFRSLPTLPSALRGLIRLRGQVSHVVFGGGGLFTDSSSLYAVIYWWVQFWFLRLFLQVPVHIVGQSFGPLQRPLARLLTRHVLRHSTKLSVRDGASALLVQDILPIAQPLTLPDLAFAYPLPRLSGTPPKDPLCIALSLRPWKDTHLWEQVILDTLRDFALKGPLSLILIPMQSIREEDVSLLEAFARRLRDIPNVSVTLAHLHSFGEVAETLSRCHLAIGQRLHFLLCSLRSHTPCIALSYSNKVANIMQDAHMPVLTEPEEAALTDAVTDILQTRKTYAQNAQDFSSYAEKEAKNYSKFLRDMA